MLWFTDLYSRELFRSLGYASIHQYATEALGFSRARAFQFVRLAERLQELPQLRAAVAAGSVPWTKAREPAGAGTEDRGHPRAGKGGAPAADMPPAGGAARGGD